MSIVVSLGDIVSMGAEWHIDHIVDIRNDGRYIVRYSKER